MCCGKRLCGDTIWIERTLISREQAMDAPIKQPRELSGRGLNRLQDKLALAYSQRRGASLTANQVWWLYRYLDFVSNDFPASTVGLTGTEKIHTER